MKIEYTKIIGLAILLFVSYINLYGQEGQTKLGDKYLYNDTVNIAFSTVDRANSMGTLYTVDPKETLKYDQIQDVATALVGRVPGLYEVSNLRGLGGFLYIVDGLPRDPWSINMSQVDQITVLKDINASVLYGNDAVNGIVMITTKRGKIQKNKVQVTGYYGVATPVEMPQYLSSSSYAKLYNEARVNDGLSPQYYKSDIDGYQLGEDVIRYPNVDYYSDQFLKDIKPYSNVNAEFTGGNKAATYYANMGWDRTGSYFNFGEGKNNQSNKFNFRANVDLSVNSFITTSIDASAIYQNTTTSQSDYWSAASTLRPNLFQPLIPIDKIERYDSHLLTARNIIDGKYLLGGTRQYLTNPIADMYSAGENEQVSSHFSFNNRINIDLNQFVKGLSFHTNLSFDYRTFYNQFINNKYAVYQAKVVGDSVRIVDKYNTDTRSGEQHVSGQGFQRRVGYYALLKYNRTLNDMHNLYGSLSAMGNHRKENGMLQEDKNANIGIRMAYVYDKRYGVDFSGALQNSVKLHPDKRIAFSPSVALAWTVSNEGFMSSVSAIDHLKLRASVGLLNTDRQISSYSYYLNPYANSGSFWWYDSSINAAAVRSSNGANPNLGYEKRKEINIGLESSFFNNLITIDANVYSTLFYDRITKTTTEYPSFYSDFVPYSNYDSNRFYGIDFSIAFNKSFGDFSVYLALNALYQRNEVIQKDEVYSESYQYRKGRPVDAIYGLVSDGFFQDQKDIDNHFFQTYGTVKPGDIKYIDQNNDLMINDNDMVYLGRRWSPFVYGINLRLQYKEFTFFALGNGRQGGKEILSGNYYWVDGDKKYSNIVLNRWTEATKETATYPRLSSLENNNNYRNSSFWLYDNDYFRLERVQLGYDLPKKITNLLKVQDLNVFVNATNLFTLSNYRKVKDLVVNSEPYSRYFSIGLNVNFN